MLLPLLVSFLLLLGQSCANVEKVIFLGPTADHMKSIRHPDILQLTPAQNTLRMQMHSKFVHSPPIASIPSVQWYVLDGLKPDARYEVRICWPATQPTAFDMDLFSEEQNISKDLGLPESLANDQDTKGEGIEIGTSSWLLLRVESKADFFTMNSTLMHEGLIVDIDIVLDPYLLNVFPKSLLPTGLHILVVAVLAVVAVKLVLRHLEGVIATGGAKVVQDKKIA